VATGGAGQAFFATRGSLWGVAATSARSAWAVGRSATSKTLIRRWNGSRWKRVSSPTPAGGASNALQGVATASAKSAFAVGFAVGGRALILRWNGKTWT
jgi:hypothetical protein